MDLSRAVSEKKGDICKTFQPLCINAPTGGSLENLWRRWGPNKYIDAHTRKSKRTTIYVHTFKHNIGIGMMDRQTDGIGSTISRSACNACWRAIKIKTQLLYYTTTTATLQLLIRIIRKYIVSEILMTSVMGN